jgi:microcystin-dependent protein
VEGCGELLEVTLCAEVEGLGVDLVPIGSIIAWAKNLAGVPALPEEFLECNGDVIDDADSPLDGSVLPQLNVAARFLGGAPSSGASGGSAEVTLTQLQMPVHTHTFTGPALQRHSTPAIGTPNVTSSGLPALTGPTGGGQSHENRPPFYRVVWIMRIK